MTSFAESQPTRATRPQVAAGKPHPLSNAVRGEALLQRKCACGKSGSPSLSGECEECRKNRDSAIRRGANDYRAAPRSAHSEVPSIVQEVLGSPGEPLDQATRDFMAPRFGHDFSKVRVHTDARAAESARTVNALAYTVGRDIVFDGDRHQLHSPAGQRLIAHELAHTIQQERVVAHSPLAEVENPSQEREADRAADAIGNSRPVPTLRQSPRQALAKQTADPSSSEVSRTFELDPQQFLKSSQGQAVREVDEPNNGAFFNGANVIVRRGGEKVYQTRAVSGNPGSTEAQVNIGPIPDGKYRISPQITRPTVTKLQSGICGAIGIPSGYQELTSTDASPCTTPNHYCTVSCPSAANPSQTCFTPVGCWGSKRIRIEGSATVTTAIGKHVVRDGFYIHGGDHSVDVTSGCVKTFDNGLFAELRKFKSTVPFWVNKVAKSESSTPAGH
jgi:hypothetical protein